MSKVLVCLVVFTTIVNLMFGQGIVLKDYSDHKPIYGAHIRSLNTDAIYESDNNGVVNIDKIDSKDFYHITSISYQEVYITGAELIKTSIVYMFPKINEFDPVRIIVIKGKEVHADDIPNQVEIITVSDIKLKNPQTSADILQSTGNVMVQKSQMGGGSPILRGFEANKLLLVLDGVRMNNAIYRSGHLQNSITIDNNVLKQAEIIFGPGSVIYGSDALGGVIHYRTKDPHLTNDKSLVNSSAIFTGRISSANQEKTYHFDASVGYEKFGFLTSLTYGDFGDLKMGKVRDHGDEEWGLIPFYAAYVDGEDKVLENPDPNIQKHTGYEQYDFLQKLVFAPKDDLRLSLNFNYSTSSNIPRFDMYNDVNDDGTLKWAEWDYGPQDRMLIALKTDLTDSAKYFDEAYLTAAYQWISEERIKRRFGSTDRTIQNENVKVYSINADFQKGLKKNYTLNYGLEYTLNEVSSVARLTNVETNRSTSFQTRYPDGGSDMQTLAVYVGTEKDLTEKMILNLGARYSRNILNASFVSDEFYVLPFDDIKLNNGAFTATAGIMYQIDSTWSMNALVSSGYRNPNVDDVGKIREKNGFVIVPNDEIRAEYAYNGEITFVKSFIEDNLKINLTGYYTLLNNAIVTRLWQLNGEDSLLIDGEMARITTNLNASEAYIYGFNVGVKGRLTDDISANASYNYTIGRDTSFDVPLSHIPPVFGKVELSYQKDKFSGSINSFFNAKKSIEDYGEGSTDNPSEGLAEGTPDWWTLNAYSSFYVSPNIEIQFSVENILDKHYKQFASGLSAPGRNFVFAFRASF